jgi:hypothetical protein
VTTTSTSCHAIWLIDFTHEFNDPIPIFCDYNSTIALAKNHVFHHQSKHIDTHYHFFHEIVNNGHIILHFVDLKTHWLTYSPSH